MMSSEEDTAECFGLYGDKLLSSKKTKRTRQRVDAGEPRNSYSSIPNFSSRPSFMSGGLYGALLSQSQQHFGGLFGPNGFGSAKMLNELFGRQVKSAQDASSGPESMISMESASSTEGAAMAGTVAVGANSANSTGGSGSGKLGFESAASSNNSSPVIRRRTSSSGVETDGGGSTPPQSQVQSQQQQNDLAHHMLRNILQGKKEQLMALDHELRSVAAAAAQRSSPDNNNSISKNNNTSSNNNNNSSTVNSNNSASNSVNCAPQDVKSEVIAAATKVNNLSSGSVPNAGVVGKTPNSQQQKGGEEFCGPNATGLGAGVAEVADEDNSKHGEILQSDRVSSQLGMAMKKEHDDLLDEDEEMMGLNSSHSDLESLGSVDSLEAEDVRMKEELIDADMNLEKELANTSSLNQCGGGGTGKEPVALDMKRARVENIVSTMRSSPSLTSHPQVNGCKKRKLYQPQQHDNSAAERYAAVAAGLNLNIGLNMHGLIIDDDDDDEIESPQIQQKRDEKNALKSQLRSMQEQLAEMQQKYVQLCSRMEQESECQEIEDTGSDIVEQDLDQDENNDSPSAEKPQPERSSPMLSPLKELSQKNNNAPNMLSHMMSKMMSSKMRNALGSHHQMAQSFNGAHPLLQHMHSGMVNEHNLPSSHMSHHAISNAAAMYLGQKFFLEQEARLAKEAAEHHGRQQLHQQHHHQQQQHHHHHHHQQQQQQIHQQHQNHQQQQLHQQPNQEQQSQQQPQHQSQSNQVQQQPQQPQPTFQPTAQISQAQQPQQLQQQANENAQASAPAQHPSAQASQPSLRQSPMTKLSTVQSDLSEKFNIIRSSTNSVGPMSGSELEGLADILKSEITASLSTLVDSIVTRFVHQRRYLGKQSEAAAAAAEQLNKDLLMASQLLDRKSPRIKVADRSNLVNGVAASAIVGNSIAGNTGSNQSGNCQPVNSANGQASHGLSHSSNSMLSNQNAGQRLNGSAFPPMGLPMHVNGPVPSDNSSTNLNSLNIPPPHVRPTPSAAMFQAPKPPQPMNAVAAAALYNSMNALNGHANQMNPFCMPEPRDQNMEQNEALSLVVTPKKKRHKVTDTRITPRTVSRILAQDGIGPPPPNQMDQQQHMTSNTNQSKFSNQLSAGPPSSAPSDTPSPRSSYPPPPPQAMMPVSLPTTVAIPNPSLHESQVFSPYSPFFTPHGPHGPHGPHAPQPSQLHHLKMSSSPPGLCGMMDSRDSPPLPHPQTMLHPALLAAAHHSGSPDYGHLRAAMDNTDRNSDCNSGDISFDGVQPTISFSNTNRQSKHYISLTAVNSSTLTPMHLRKAKLMFFWVRYPSSAVLKMYFPDIKFNKNNTAQLVKWFSNFREFYYIQMEKYARQAITEGVKNADDLHVNIDSELYRVLNLHYNRNNHIEVCRNQVREFKLMSKDKILNPLDVPTNFRYVVEQTLREFFRAIQSGKDAEQSWKKSIYKIISRLDDPVPEYFKSPNFLEQLE